MGILPPLCVLSKYLVYLLGQPETRLNNSLIDCTIYLMQNKADTEERLNGRD